MRSTSPLDARPQLLQPSKACVYNRIGHAASGAWTTDAALTTHTQLARTPSRAHVLSDCAKLKLSTFVVAPSDKLLVSVTSPEALPDLA